MVYFYHFLPTFTIKTNQLWVPSRELTYPPLGKGKSSSKLLGRGYVGSQEGKYTSPMGSSGKTHVTSISDPILQVVGPRCVDGRGVLSYFYFFLR